MPTNTPQPRSKDLRKGRVSLPGQVYHITTSTSDRAPVFADWRSARILINTLREAQMRGSASTLAFVVMPDHLHWLLQLGEGVLLPKLVGSVKAVTAHQLGQPIWQTGFHDHALRHEDDVMEVARYIIANPLRAGLVEHMADYPHWDAVWL